MDHMDVAVRRAAVTGANQSALRLQDALADEMDSDLVETTAHSGARPEHALWPVSYTHLARHGQNVQD